MNPFWKLFYPPKKMVATNCNGSCECPNEEEKETHNKRAIFCICSSFISRYFCSIDDVSLEVIPYITDVPHMCAGCKKNLSLTEMNVFDCKWCYTCIKHAMKACNKKHENLYFAAHIVHIALLINDICVECSCSDVEKCDGWLTLLNCIIFDEKYNDDPYDICTRNYSSAWRRLCTALKFAYYAYDIDEDENLKYWATIHGCANSRGSNVAHQCKNCYCGFLCETFEKITDQALRKKIENDKTVICI